METPNLKIQVNSPEESERAQRAFFAIGTTYSDTGADIREYELPIGFLFHCDERAVITAKGILKPYLLGDMKFYYRTKETKITLEELEALAAKHGEPQMTAAEESALEAEIDEVWSDYQERALTEAEQRSVEVEQRRYEAAVSNYEKKSKFNGEYVNISEIIFESLKIAAGLIPIPSKNA